MPDPSALDRMVARLETVSEMDRRVVSRARSLVERELSAQIARGEGPDGRAWKLRLDGKKALASAAKSLTIQASGRYIVIRLRGPVVKHHAGRARGGVVRQILPSGGIPKRWKRGIDLLFRQELAR